MDFGTHSECRLECFLLVDVTTHPECRLECVLLVDVQTHPECRLECVLLVDVRTHPECRLECCFSARCFLLFFFLFLLMLEHIQNTDWNIFVSGCYNTSRIQTGMFLLVKGVFFLMFL